MKPLLVGHCTTKIDSNHKYSSYVCRNISISEFDIATVKIEGERLLLLCPYHRLMKNGFFEDCPLSRAIELPIKPNVLVYGHEYRQESGPLVEFTYESIRIYENTTFNISCGLACVRNTYSNLIVLFGFIA